MEGDYKDSGDKPETKSLLNPFIEWTKANTTLSNVSITNAVAMQFTKAARDLMEKVEGNGNSCWNIVSLKFNFPQQRVNKVYYLTLLIDYYYECNILSLTYFTFCSFRILEFQDQSHVQ